MHSREGAFAMLSAEVSPMKNRTLVVAVAATTLFATGYVAAEINAAKYPHMSAAYGYGKQAYMELTQVEHNHGPAVDAHVNKAKQLLMDANKELDEAAAAADAHK
jgi:hypothetical protein